MLSTIVVVTSCGSDDPKVAPNPEPEPTPILQKPQKTGDKMTISFYDPIRQESAKYETVRIGEYLWTTSNINHYPTQTTLINKNQINLALTRYRLDPNAYNVSVQDINKYFGPYYTRTDFEEIEGNRKRYQITEIDEVAPISSWGSPSLADITQLFAMCGEGDEHDTRTILTSKPGSNPAAINNYTYWFSNINTNKFGFNMMPNGARFNGEQQWKLEHNHNASDSETFNVVAGDFYGFLESAIFLAWDGRATIDDYIKIDKQKNWHWMSIRWCRQLTDAELGYKLYVNNNYTDIKKLGLDENAPQGYAELPKGALRGFYVQYVLDGVSPKTTVAEMASLAKKLSY